MERTNRWMYRAPRHLAGGFGWSRAAALLLGASLAQPCRADSTLQAGAPNSGPLAGTAHLDFRITVLPSLALSTQGPGVRIQGNSGVLTLQRSRTDAPDGRTPTSSTQLSPRHQVVDTAMHASNVEGGSLVTIASP